MSMALIRFGCTRLLTIPLVVELLTWMGVAGCVCPISCKMVCSSTAFRALIYMAPSSALAADDITPFMILATL